MDQMTSAMLEMADMDELSRMDSFVHRRHPLSKLLITIIYIFAVVSVGSDDLTGIVPLVLYPILVFQLSGIPVKTCFYKLRVIIPIVCAVGIWNPILDRTPALQLGRFVITSGMLSFVTLMFKGIWALMASFLLIATTNIEKICYALSLLHVPDILVTQTLITYRYISLLLRQAGTMSDAYRLRAPGQKGIHISAWGSFLGQLLLRSMDRAQELYKSMELRGFHGSFYYANVQKADRTDYIYTAVCIGVILLLRFVNVSELLGSLII
jgi:cobalt/nickel transport system permease protein